MTSYNHQALQTGVIDGTEGPLSNLWTQKQFEVQKHVTLTYHTISNYVVVVNKPFWDKLPAEAQASLRKSAATVGEEIRRNSRAEDTAAISTMRDKHHLKINAVPAGAEKEWQDEIAKLYPRLRGTVVPADLFDEVVAALKEFRAQKSADASPAEPAAK